MKLSRATRDRLIHDLLVRSNVTPQRSRIGMAFVLLLGGIYIYTKA